MTPPPGRVDGPDKVTGAARYAADQRVPGLTHAVLVQSTIARGRITRIDTAAAEAAPGVLAVCTHENMPRFAHRPTSWLPPHAQSTVPLQEPDIWYGGQHVAVVVADTLERAHEAARLVRVDYDAETPTIGLRENLGRAYTPPDGTPGALQLVRGDPEAGLAAADARIEAEYTTAVNHHNPIEPSATLAVWEGENLTLYESTQSITYTREVVAEMLGVPAERVRVVTPFLGGGFGSKGFVWPHTYIVAAVARQLRRPVRLVLTRAQMSTSCGHRPASVQRLRAGATRDGRLTGLTHHIISHSATRDLIHFNPVASTQAVYTCPGLRVSTQVVEVDMGTTMATRPPSGPANEALEMALDELSWELGMDPVALRLANYAASEPGATNPETRFLRECYELGAERFGWPRSRPEPGSMREGETLVGWGMAGSYHRWHGMRAQAAVEIGTDGRAIVRSGTQDIGTGTYTIMTEIAAEALGMRPASVRPRLGDTRYPPGPTSSGSTTAATVGVAVREAGRAAREKVTALAVADPRSPLYGAAAGEVGAADDRLFLTARPRRGETYRQIMERHGAPVHASGSADLGTPAPSGAGSYGAAFAEVRVSAVTGEVRVSRMVSALDVGRVLNAATARSQAIGGMIWGIGMALTEHTLVDRRLGRIVTANLAGYLVPVEADVPDLDVIFVDRPDPHANALGARGMGEVAGTGTAAAIANAVYHATGHRVRHLPITPDLVLAAGEAAATE
ncbi:acylaldehyde oxidase [Microtetraspora sp. NBRC 13810]|uniref:xanthine dehydrogenase family protein molybdopterin-binding subunit n=1 Tax=Microtetraspora sp. NBRC 13810 TaxID=3030990 RepID=UPI0024A4C41C|nr:xanthine dehydrogenase family protein molybdopterin-binding subunit [Microtetraspora sp. NBRC 13810]GLW05179.1 acylaldehyde oxidase [Microtetraspora sp. NBRC 13810]